MNDPHFENAVSTSGQSDEYPDGILGESSHLSDQQDYLASPSSGYPDRPGHDFPTREDIYENQSPYSLDNDWNDYERGAFDNDYNSPDYGEDKAYYSLPTSNWQETETQDLNYRLDNHSENFSPYSTNSTQLNDAQSWEYSNQYSLGSFPNPYMNKPRLQNNPSLEKSNADDNNSGDSNPPQNGYQKGYHDGHQDGIQTSASTVAMGASASLGVSALNKQPNVTHLNVEANTIASHNSEGTNVHGHQIKQQGSFAMGVNVGEVEADELAGNVYNAQHKNLAETAAEEIQQLFKKLKLPNCIESIETEIGNIEAKIGKMEIPKHIEMIKNNPKIRRQVIEILKKSIR